MAHLLLKKALSTLNAASALPFVEEALKILRSHIADQKNVSLHALHIFGSQMLRYIWQWVPTMERATRFRDVHDELRRAIPDHLRTHPDLSRVIEDLKRAELETAIRRVDPTAVP
jgi:hypothetical protein